MRVLLRAVRPLLRLVRPLWAERAVRGGRVAVRATPGSPSSRDRFITTVAAGLEPRIGNSPDRSTAETPDTPAQVGASHAHQHSWEQQQPCCQTMLRITVSKIKGMSKKNIIHRPFIKILHIYKISLHCTAAHCASCTDNILRLHDCFRCSYDEATVILPAGSAIRDIWSEFGLKLGPADRSRPFLAISLPNLS